MLRGLSRADFAGLNARLLMIFRQYAVQAAATKKDNFRFAAGY